MKQDIISHYKQLLNKDILEAVKVKGNKIIRLKPPFMIVSDPVINKAVFNKLPTRVESGGIFACQPIVEAKKKVLKIKRVYFIKNVSRKPAISYRPSGAGWHRAMSKTIFEDGLLPLEFHSHPVSKRKPGQSFFEYLHQMGASIPDQQLAEPTFDFGIAHVAIPQAILIKNIQTLDGFFVGIYGGLIAPKDFEPMIAKTGTEKAIELSEKFAEFLCQQLATPRKSEIAKMALIVAGILGVVFFKQAISFLSYLLVIGSISVWRLIPLAEAMGNEPLPYFGLAKISKELSIYIPPFQITDYSSREIQRMRLRIRKSRSFQRRRY